ncbi:GNAT family N-acetyltransferase [Novosphingobium profundi]|uniref:GNAT family N-acetyltransferase n=1 Tax=Novosphingobium profundi TaxID=1774954 RepID=UPI001BD9A687|nr:GNAT family N-acetyltransferase [Novosphingobium profundi]
MPFDDATTFLEPPPRTGAPDARGAALPDRIESLDWREFETRRDEWDELARTASEPNPFFESWYLLPSLRHLEKGASVRVLRFEQDGRLAGLLPMVASGRYYRWPLPHLASWLHENCFCGTPLVRAGAEVAFWRAVLDWADRKAGTALFLHLREMVMDGPVHVALLAVARYEGRQVEQVHAEARAMLASDLSPQAYLAQALSTKKRKELRRQANRLAEEGALAHHVQRGDEDLETWCTAFLALEKAGWKGAAGSALACNERTAALFHEVLQGAADHGALERRSLLLDGRPIAMLASLRSGNAAFSYKTAFDEGYARFSPGVLLQQENLSALDDPELAWIDSCASAHHPMIDHLWRERRGIARLSVALGGPLRRAAFRRIVAAEMKRKPKMPPA